MVAPCLPERAWARFSILLVGGFALVTLATPSTGSFVAVGAGPDSSVVRTSGDGLHWTGQASFPGLLTSVASDGKIWVAVGGLTAEGPGVVHTSVDGVEWSLQAAVSPQGLDSVAHRDGLWVAVGGAGIILSSADGQTWVPRVSGTAETLHSVASNGTAWIAVGYAGTILTSADGFQWASRQSGTSERLYAVAWADEWVAVGAKGTILQSSDGIFWKRQAVATSAILAAAAHDGTHWVVVSPNGAVLAQQLDGAWVDAAGPPVGLSAILHCGRWIGAGGGTILTSEDAETWTTRSTKASDDVFSIASDSSCPVAPTTAEGPADPPPSAPAPPPPAPPDPAAAPAEEPFTEPPPLPAMPEAVAVEIPPPVEGVANIVAPAPPSVHTWPYAPITIASGTGLVAGLLMARFLLPVGLFTRLRVNRLLEQPLRADIYALIKAEPGIHFREIARRVNREFGVVKHHLNALCEGNLVRGETSPTLGHRRFFAMDVSDPRIIKAVSALWTPTTRRVMHAIAAGPGSSLETVASTTGIAYNVVQRHARKLRGAGLVATQRRGRILRVSPTALALRILGPSAPVPWKGGPYHPTRMAGGQEAHA